jgi:Pro-kumamolisin, activation domain
MRTTYLNTNKVLLAFALFSLVALRASAQSTYSQPRIVAAVNDAKLTVLHGNTHPLAQPQFDRGPAPAGLAMQHMLLVLQRSPAQEAALESFMAEQLDRSSPEYHHWLTPQEFGQMYGPAQQDIDVITKWLGSHGFQVENVGAGRTTIQFSGNAGQVQAAFHTTIHQYVVKGAQHWANSSDPSIPTALTPVVAGIRSLHNFYPKPQARLRRASSSLRPGFTFNNGQPCDISGDTNDLCFAVGPNDFATIYNVQQLWNNGIDGTGETIGIVGDSNINTADVAQFRALFSLPPNVPNVITPDGAVSTNDDEIEAVLDTEWSGAVAKAATIDLVIAPSSQNAGTFGGDLAAQYIINCQTTGPNCSVGAVPAKILSESFGECELGLGTTANAMYNTMWQQAAAEGITVLVAAGDDGSAACDIDEINGPILQPASNGLQVSGVASTPYNLAVGGTDFNDLGTQVSGGYWNSAPGTQSSAIKYIPEDVWNDTCTNPLVFPLVSVDPPITTALESCNNLQVQEADLVEVTGGGGGESNCTTSNGSTPSSCSGGNTKPPWQVTAGTPGTTRDIPDLSLFAGDGFAGSFYVMCEMDTSAEEGGQGGEPCALGTSPLFVGVGGTSVSVQAFAGIMALVEQQHGAQGNAGAALYTIAAGQSNTCVVGTTCTFNDITVGTNAMPCTLGSLDCSTAASVPNLPSSPDPRITVRTVRILCALCIGLLLLLGLRRRQQRWITAAALCGTAVLLVVSIGCGGNNNSGTSTGGGSQQGSPEGVMSSYNAGPGYDLASGLGSVNANNLVLAAGWAGIPATPPTTIGRRLMMTAPAATLAIAFALCLGLVFVGLRRRQVRWSTAVLLLAFALSILNAARTSASTHAGNRTTRRPVASTLVSSTGSHR